MRRSLAALVLGLIVILGFNGCSFFHNLQPHRLRKLNHSMDGMSSDAYSLNLESTEGTYFASVVEDIDSE